MGNIKAKNTKDEIGCGSCSTMRRVLNMSELENGMHICEPGRNKLTYKQKRHSLKAQYFHHAIIGEIKDCNDYEITFLLIHYTNVTGLKKGSIEMKVEKRHLKYDEIYIVDYTYPKYPLRKIVQRAKKEAKKDEQFDDNENEGFRNAFGTYNLFVSNCEHFATWCVLGSKESFQIDQKWRVYLFPLKISSGIAGILSQLILEILRLFASLVSEEKIYGPGFSILIIGAFYLLLLFGRYINLHTKHCYYKNVCQHCYQEKKSILVIKLFWFIFSGMLFYFITKACMSWFPPWPVTILLHFIFIILSIFFRWLYKCMKSPFMCSSTKAGKLTDIKRGHVITFRHLGIQHFALITKIDHDKGEIYIIHYKGFFNIKLIEDKIYWCKHSIWRLRLTKLSTYKANKRISRMQSRLNETKWHWHLNRSEHVCYWASIKQKNWKYYQPVNNKETLNQTETDSLKKSSLVVEIIEVNLRSEVEEGDVIEFSIKSNKKENGSGIIIAIQNTAEMSNYMYDRIFTLVIVKQKNRYAERSDIQVDLNTDTIKVKKFHPVHCNNMQERKNLAIQAFMNKQKHKEFKFVEFCVLKEWQPKTQNKKKEN